MLLLLLLFRLPGFVQHEHVGHACFHRPWVIIFFAVETAEKQFRGIRPRTCCHFQLHSRTLRLRSKTEKKCEACCTKLFFFLANLEEKTGLFRARSWMTLLRIATLNRFFSAARRGEKDYVCLSDNLSNESFFRPPEKVRCKKSEASFDFSGGFILTSVS